MKQDNTIEVRELCKNFGSFKAVEKLSFEVRKGEIFGFLGPNGAGKSTTIRMLCGLLKPSSGYGKVTEFDVMSESEKIKKHIGYMSQKFSLYRDLTAEENLDFYAGVYEVSFKNLKKRKEEVMALTGLAPERHRMTSLLTGGWRQRLALACALIHNPPIIFLDEPTSGVDPISRRDFWDIIQALSTQGVTTLVTTHYLEEAEYCEKLSLISAGKMLAYGTPEELKNSFKGSIYYMETSDLQKTAELLEQLPSPIEFSLWGEGIHISAEDGKEAEKELTERLKSAGIEILEYKKERVTLEDLFVHKVLKGREDGS